MNTKELNDVKEFWEKQSGIWAERWRGSQEELFKDYLTKGHLRNALRYVKGGGRILDIGCGDARYFTKLDARFREYWGIELSPLPLNSAKVVFEGGNYIVADAYGLPFKDGCFSTIMSWGVFEHNSDITTIFRECYRVLEKGGVLLFSILNYVSPYFPYCYTFHRLLGHDRIPAIGYYYRRGYVINQLEKVGFCQARVVDSLEASPVPLFHRLFRPLERLGLGFMMVYRATKP